MNSPALSRLRASAARILLHLGEVTTFQRFAAVKDKRLGAEGWAASGEPIQARASVNMENRRKADGLWVREERIEVEYEPFAPYGGLSSSFKVMLDGSWCSIGDVTLSDDSTAWEGTVTRG